MIGSDFMSENNNVKRLFVDMDGTLAEFKPVKKIEELYEKSYFLDLKPNITVVRAVNDIVGNHPEVEVNILSAVLSDSEYALSEKKAWLKKYLPDIPDERCFFPSCGTDKKLAIPDGVRSTDFLLDDYTKNLNDWEPPARGIKLLNGINHTKMSWGEDRISITRKPYEFEDALLAVISTKSHVYDLTPQESSKTYHVIATYQVMQENKVVDGESDLYTDNYSEVEEFCKERLSNNIFIVAYNSKTDISISAIPFDFYDDHLPFTKDMLDGKEPITPGTKHYFCQSYNQNAKVTFQPYSENPMPNDLLSTDDFEAAKKFIQDKQSQNFTTRIWDTTENDILL